MNQWRSQNFCTGGGIFFSSKTLAILNNFLGVEIYPSTTPGSPLP